MSAPRGEPEAPGWVRLLVRAYPRRFRDRVGAELLRSYVVERRRVRGLKGLAFVLRTAADLMVGAALEQMGERRRGAEAARMSGTGTGWEATMWEGWSTDARIAARGLRKTPGFTIVALLTFALGVCATTSVYSVVDGLLLRPLPYPDSDDLVEVFELGEQRGRMQVTGPNFLDWKATLSSFEHLVARTHSGYSSASTVLSSAQAVRVPVDRVTDGFFEMMGISPVVGRALSDGDYRPDAPGAAVVSHAFWQTHLGGGSPGDLTLSIGSTTYSVVGVMPAGFDFPEATQVWLPLDVRGGVSRTAHNWSVTGRLAEGVSLLEANAELDRVTARLHEQYQEDMSAVSARAIPLQEELYGAMGGPLLLLLGASALVLLVACTNLATTLLARGRSRTGEILVRTALGAPRVRLVRLLLTETMILAVAGAVLGTLLTIPTLRFFLTLGPPALGAQTVLDPRVWLVTTFVSVVTMLVFGLLPAVSGTRSDIATGLRGTDRRGGRKTGAWGTLVATEVALSVVLLVGSVVLTRSFLAVVTVDLGFDARGLMTAEISFPGTVFEDEVSLVAAQSQLLQELERVPGVRSAGLINHLPLAGLAFNGGFDLESGEAVQGRVDYRVASDGYFETMDIPVLEGRFFRASDDAAVDDVAVVSETMARRFFPEGAVGRRIKNLRNDSWIYPDRLITIVGVVGDVRHRDMTAEPVPTVYVHSAQRPARASSPFVVLRMDSTDDPALGSLVRQSVARVDRRIPVELSSMEARAGASTADRRFLVVVLASFSLAALVLSGVGIYGVVSFAVERRSREMGIRLALGADPGSVRRLVLQHSLKTVALGAIVGVLLTVFSTRLLEGFVFGVEPGDIPSALTGAGTLVLVGLVASWAPAHRATNLQPVEALGTD